MKEKMKILTIVSEGVQTRNGLCAKAVRDYAKAMGEGVVFDPPIVFFDSEKHYLVDGFHRVEAMKLRGETEVEVEVREGSHADAMRYALVANAKHGIRRTPDDIRHSLEVAWENRVELFGGEPSNEVLAQACAVSVRTVIRFFNRQKSTSDSVTSRKPVTLVSADGKKRKSTKGAGKRKASKGEDALATEGAQGEDALATEGAQGEDALPTEGTQGEDKPKTEGESHGENRDSWADRHLYGSEIFKGFCDEYGEKARDTYIASEYGSFGKGKFSDCEWTADRCGRKVPARLRKIINLGALDDFETLRACVNRAYIIVKDSSEDPFMSRLTDGYDTPLYALKDALEAINDFKIFGLCPDCQGKGCDRCHRKGYETWADFKKHSDELRKKREKKEAAPKEPQPKEPERFSAETDAFLVGLTDTPTEEAMRILQSCEK